MSFYGEYRIVVEVICEKVMSRRNSPTHWANELTARERIIFLLLWKTGKMVRVKDACYRVVEPSKTSIWRISLETLYYGKAFLVTLSNVRFVMFRDRKDVEAFLQSRDRGTISNLIQIEYFKKIRQPIPKYLRDFQAIDHRDKPRTPTRK